MTHNEDKMTEQEKMKIYEEGRRDGEIELLREILFKVLKIENRPKLEISGL